MIRRGVSTIYMCMYMNVFRAGEAHPWIKHEFSRVQAEHLIAIYTNQFLCRFFFCSNYKVKNEDISNGDSATCCTMKNSALALPV